MRLLFAAIVTALLGLATFFFYSETYTVDAFDIVRDVIPALAPEPVTLVFTGDVMFDRGVRRHALRFGDESLFANLKETMRSADAVVVNLETTLTDKSSVASIDSSRLEFTSDPRFANLLASLNTRIATLSNNHTDDFGTTGLTETRGHLAFAGIDYYGSPHNLESDLSVETSVRDMRTCFVGYQGFINADPTPAATEIARLRSRCDYLVATMHAGDEYVHEPNATQVRAARAFIDAGADVVIGTHPHVVQPLEVYAGKPIFYSLGNTMFDQDFSWETTHAVLVKAIVSDDEVAYEIEPISVIQAEASLVAEDATRDRLLSLLVGPSTPPDTARTLLSTGSFIVESRAILPQ